MGYRSEVYIAVQKSDEVGLDAILTEHNLLRDEAFTKKEYLGYVIYEASWLKWYEGYKDVGAVNEFIEANPLDYENDGRCLVCVGEDEQIHSEIGMYQDIFNIYTNVELQ
jgi:hypothetical protein